MSELETKNQDEVLTTAELKQALMFMIQREKRAIQKDLDKEKQDAAKSKQLAKNVDEEVADLCTTQANCDHMKGGTNKKPDKIDYALFYHVYINQKCVIGCQICRMKWRPGDTKLFLNQNGKRVKNHTELSWDDVFELMSKRTTNSMTSAEAPKFKNVRKGLRPGIAEESADDLPDA
jgi:hypothetical protein